MKLWKLPHLSIINIHSSLFNLFMLKHSDYNSCDDSDWGKGKQDMKWGNI